MKNLIRTLIALCVLSQLTLKAEEIASSAPSIYLTGHIKKPQRILAFAGATLGGVLAQSGGVDAQGHVIFVYRETLDGVYLYSFEVSMLKSMGVSMFTIFASDRIHVADKQVLVGPSKMPKRFEDLLNRAKSPSYRVDYTKIKKQAEQDIAPDR